LGTIQAEIASKRVTHIEEDASPSRGINLMPYAISKIAEKEFDKNLQRSREKLRGLWTPSKVRALSSNVIIQKIESAGMKFDQDLFLKECQNEVSAWEVSSLWRKQIDTDLEREMKDFTGLAACILWERLNPEAISYEMLDDMMQSGYRLDGESKIKACDEWWRTWKAFEKLFDLESKNLDEVDYEFPGTQCFSNWSQDFRLSLLNASFKDKKYAKLGIEYCSEFLSFFENEDDLTIKNFQSDLAEMYALAGNQEKAEKMMSDLIAKEPHKARGYVTLAQVISYGKRNGGDARVDEQLQILEKARAYSVVDGEDFSLSHRIADLKRDLAKASSTDFSEGSLQKL